MPPISQTRPKTNVIADRNSHTITLTRTFAAPREQVFEAWTQPEHVACWWNPTGEPLKECTIDLRTGGSFKFVDRADADAHPFTGVYREIVPPERIVFEAMGAVGRVVLSAVGNETHMTVSIQCSSAAQLDQFIKMGVDVGTAQTLDNLVAYVGAMHGRNVARPTLAAPRADR